MQRWEALKQWENALLLFPECIDDEILETLDLVATYGFSNGVYENAYPSRRATG
jgi:hypothetical protein